MQRQHIDAEKLRTLMSARGLDVSALAVRAGLSRQGLYRFLRPDYRPFSAGFEAVAAALGVMPVSLLRAGDEGSEAESLSGLVVQAEAGEARAFELLPAELLRAGADRRCRSQAFTPLQHRLLAAAAELACAIAPRKAPKRLAARHAALCAEGRAFFFAGEYMSAERIVAATPEPMKRHLVFGAFDMGDFARHVQ